MVFDCEAVGGETQLAEFGLARRSAMIDLSVYDQTATDATAGVGVKDGIEVVTRAVSRLGESCKIGIVFDGDGCINEVFEPTAEVQILPPINLMRTANPSRAPIDWTTKTDASG